MSPLPFNMPVMEFLANHRTPFLTEFFLAFTTFGTFNVYILLITLIYVTRNKHLAIRLAILLLFTSTLNGLLKLTIRNPRPFVREGTYAKQWAIPARDIAATSAEYSTPSGHAMSAAAFYSYLYWCCRNWYVRALAVAAIVFIGLSRPYLGVHFVEDVLLGWALGIGCAAMVVKYTDAFCVRWNRLSHLSQIAMMAGASLVLCVIAIALNGGSANGAPAAFMGSAGCLMGIVIGRPLEMRLVNFDPKSSHDGAKLGRFILTGSLAQCSLIFLNPAMGHLSGELAWLGFVLEYVRFAAAGFAIIFLAPYLFTRMGLAKRMPAAAN